MAGQDASAALQRAVHRLSGVDGLAGNARQAQCGDGTARWIKKTVDEATIGNIAAGSSSHKPSQADRARQGKCGDMYPQHLCRRLDRRRRTQYHKGGPDDLQRSVKVMVMAESAGLWFMSRQFGLSLTAADVVWPNRRVSGIDAFTFGCDLKKTSGRSYRRPWTNSFGGGASCESRWYNSGCPDRSHCKSSEVSM